MAVKFVICGLEHSGTTLLSDIFRQVPELDSGFEVGVLLCQSPKDFSTVQPFYKNMLDGWQITEGDLASIIDTDSFSEFYGGLEKKSKVLKPSTKTIFDKTPRYFSRIFECSEKLKVPFIATYKDPRSLVFSDFKRTGKGEKFIVWYEKYKEPKLRYLENIYKHSYIPLKKQIEQNNNSSILCVSLEEICLNTRQTMDLLFSHVGIEFKLEYLLLNNLRYSHTRKPEVSSRIPFEYIDNLTKEQYNIIENDFSLMQSWFYR
jgi:Sulfotransferase family